MSAIDTANTVVDVDFTSKTKQLSDRELMVGFTTKQVLIRLQEEVEPSKFKKFYTGVRAFFTGCLTYIVSKFPWDDALLRHACFVDFEKWKTCSFHSVQYFLE